MVPGTESWSGPVGCPCDDKGEGKENNFPKGGRWTLSPDAPSQLAEEELTRTVSEEQ